MTNTLHTRARDLITASSVEGLTAADSVWLQQHLASCSECSQYAEAMTLSRNALHSLSFKVNPALISATHARVRLRAQELREHDHRMIPILISCVLALTLGAITTPFVWQTFASIGRAIRIPAPVWQVAFAATWFTPAIIATIILLMLRTPGPQPTAE